MNVASTSCSQRNRTVPEGAVQPNHCRPTSSRQWSMSLPNSRLSVYRQLGGPRHNRGCSKRLHIPKVNPLDLAWGTSINIDAQSVAAQLFASSIFPYAAFLYFLTKSKKTPGLALFGFYFLLVFVFATIPAGIYAKTKYGTILANVDYLHGSAESLLTITNLLIVIGVRQGIREAERAKAAAKIEAQPELQEENQVR